MPNSKQIVYLSPTQYAELIANGTITVDGVTVTYDENDIYVTPQAEPVTDVRINGTSIAANGVAEIPTGDATQFGVMRAGGPTFGVTANNGIIAVSGASSSQVKAGGGAYLPIVTQHQHEATFYGLAKVAGHDEKDSTEPLGTYTPEAKGAIQQMLGVSDLIATSENSLVASKAYAIGDVFTANGKLYKATAVIAADAAIIPAVESEEITGANCEETSVGEGFVKFTDYAGVNVPGIVGINPDYGIAINNTQPGHYLYLNPASPDQIKAGKHSYKPITADRQEKATFYGLSKVAGVDLANENVTLGTYPETSKAAIRTMLGATSPNVIAVQDTQPTDADTKIWLPETAETPVTVPTVAEMNAALATKMSAVFEGDGLVIISAAGFAEGGTF